MIAASVFGLLLLLTVLVTEVQENVEVDGVAHAKDVMRTQFINQHESHLADPKVRLTPHAQTEKRKPWNTESGAALRQVVASQSTTALPADSRIPIE